MNFFVKSGDQVKLDTLRRSITFRVVGDQGRVVRFHEGLRFVAGTLRGSVMVRS